MNTSLVAERGQVLAFTAVLLAFVAVPLLALALEVPRWYLARQDLQAAADTAATAAASLGWDVLAFVDSGQVRFDQAQAETVARTAFAEAITASHIQPHNPALIRLAFDDVSATVNVEAQVELPPLLPLAPTLRLRVFAAAQAQAALPAP